MEFQHFSIQPHLDLYVLPTEKFKTVSVKTFLTSPLDEETSYRALIPYVLKKGCRDFPSYEAIQRQMESLYGGALSANLVKRGERQIISFKLSFPNERFLPSNPPISSQMLDLFSGVLYRPVLEDNRFRSAYVEVEKQQMKTFIDSMYNDKGSHAIRRCIHHMCADEPFRRFQYGDRDELDQITSQGLYEYYRRFIAAVPMSVYVVGHVDPETWRDLVEEALSREEKDPYRLTPPEEGPGQVEYSEVREEAMVTQSHLVMGLRSAITYRKGDVYGLEGANGLFGVFPHSKMFENVREKSGLAYSVSSISKKTKGLLLAYAGIDGKNYEKVRDLIRKQLEDIQRGEISDFELESTIQGLANGVRSIQDSPAHLIDFAFLRHLNQRRETLDDVLKEVQTLTVDRISQAAQGLTWDTTYLLTQSE